MIVLCNDNLDFIIINNIVKLTRKGLGHFGFEIWYLERLCSVKSRFKINLVRKLVVIKFIGNVEPISKLGFC